MIFVLARAITYSTLFVGFLLVFIPSRILSRSGILRPTSLGIPQAGGLALVVAGAAIAVWCILTFVFQGRGTPAPFDPPRRLVIRGPYRFARNPMYLGAALAMGGASLFNGSWPLLAYALLFLGAAHVLVITYEEPTLSREFGEEYAAYRQRVRRWWPRPDAARPPHSASRSQP